MEQDARLFAKVFIPKRERNVMKTQVVVNDHMQRGYIYFLTEPTGENFNPEFKPELTPVELLELGVFGGKYMTDCRGEFPESWFNPCEALSRAACSGIEFLRGERLEIIAILDGKGLDIPGRPARVVPVVLPVLYGSAVSGR